MFFACSNSCYGIRASRSKCVAAFHNIKISSNSLCFVRVIKVVELVIFVANPPSVSFLLRRSFDFPFPFLENTWDPESTCFVAPSNTQPQAAQSEGRSPGDPFFSLPLHPSHPVHPYHSTITLHPMGARTQQVPVWSKTDIRRRSSAASKARQEQTSAASFSNDYATALPSSFLSPITLEHYHNPQTKNRGWLQAVKEILGMVFRNTSLWND